MKRETFLWEMRVRRVRRLDFNLTRRPMLNGADVADAMAPLLDSLMQEAFWTLLLDGKGGPVGAIMISLGSLTASLVHPREVFGPAYVRGAASIVLVHNHPSGNPTPSTEDVALTRRLIDVGTTLGIPVIDHVIVGDGKHFSMAAMGMLPGLSGERHGDRTAAD